MLNRRIGNHPRGISNQKGHMVNVNEDENENEDKKVYENVGGKLNEDITDN
jgi:hypothetical protein